MQMRDGVVKRGERCDQARRQDAGWDQIQDSRPGRQVPVTDTVKGFKEILDGKHDEVPEGNFYMRGRIEEINEAEK